MVPVPEKTEHKRWQQHASGLDGCVIEKMKSGKEQASQDIRYAQTFPLQRAESQVGHRALNQTAKDDLFTNWLQKNETAKLPKFDPAQGMLLRRIDSQQRSPKR